MSINKHLKLLSKYRGSNTTPPPPPPPPVTPTWKAAQTGTIMFTDADVQASKPGVQKTNWVLRNTNAFTRFKTTDTSINVLVAGNHIMTNQYAKESDCEVLVDGVYHTSVRVTAADTLQSYPVTLPAGEKVVKLVNGYAIDIPGGGGVCVQGVETTGSIQIENPFIPADKWLLVGDSITTGSDSIHPALTGYAGLFRADGDYFVQVDSYGARQLPFTRILARKFALEISQQLNGSVTNRLTIKLGTNNFGLSGNSAADYKTLYGWLLDEIRAIRPDIEIWCISATDRTNYSTPNAGGSTLADYDTAIKQLVVARPGVKYIYGKTLCSLSDMPDGLHPGTVGHQNIYTNLKARILAGGDNPAI